MKIYALKDGYQQALVTYDERKGTDPRKCWAVNEKVFRHFIKDAEPGYFIEAMASS